MGEVYKARDPRLARDVAIKVLPEGLLGSSLALDRFRREARAVAALQHPNICTVYDVGESSDHQQFIVMELLQGETVQQRLTRGPFDVPQLIDLGISLADALDTAHHAAIVHRDIKPANIFLTARDLKILDFGLAKTSPAAFFASTSHSPTLPAGANLTDVGITVGTLAYMSPEQVRGETLDWRSDLFSLGVVLYEMGTGQQAFSGPTAGVIFDAILNKAPASPTLLNPRLPPGIEVILNKALEKDRSLRYQSAADVRTDLQRLKRDVHAPHVDTPAAPPARLTPVTAGRDKRSTGKTSKIIDSLAVLPLENGSGDPEAEYLSDGIAETLINTLAQLRKIRVVPRTLSFKYRGTGGDPLAAGRKLGVRAVLSGRMMQHGDDLVVSMELVDVDRQAQLWGGRLRRKMTDLVALQEDLATEIAGKLRLQLSGDEKKRLRARATQHTEAFRLVLMAQHYLGGSSPESIRRGITLCKQAIAIDPTYAAAHARLSQAYSFLRFFGYADPSELAAGMEAARAALTLDDTLADAHIGLAWSLLYQNWDPPGTEREVRRALELNPDSADAFALLGLVRFSQGREEAAIAAGRRAVGLAPFYNLASFCLGITYMNFGRFDQAIEQLRKTLEIDPLDANTHGVLASVYAAVGRRAQALEECETALRLDRGTSFIRLQNASTYAVLGEVDQARAIVEEIQRNWTPDGMSSFWVAVVHAALGEDMLAFEWLEKAFQEHAAFMIFLNGFGQLRRRFDKDPRFEALVKRVHAPD
jgi:non-specific serine/threonine protein kinase